MAMALTIVVVLVLLAAIAMTAILAMYASRHRREQQRIEAAISDRPAPADDLPFSPDRAGGWHGPSCSGGFPAVDPAAPHPAVPVQRTGDHDRPEPARRNRDERRGPARYTPRTPESRA
jgi:hypothetical protein